MDQSTEKDFFFAFFSDYLDDQLTEDHRARFHNLLRQPEYSSAAQAFRKQRDLLQVKLQTLILTPENFHELRLRARSDETENAIEMKEISRTKKEESLMRQLSKIAGLIVLVLFVGILTVKFSQSKAIKFDPLQALPYEIGKFETDGALNYPNNDIKEVTEYLKKVPGLNFTPIALSLDGEWQIQGATIIDYGERKITMVQFTNPTKENLFQFSFAGDIKSLPKSETGQVGQFRYQAYTSELVNIIVWQSSPTTVAMLIGRKGAEDLARLAASGI